jgi:hypothetical protein
VAHLFTTLKETEDGCEMASLDVGRKPREIGKATLKVEHDLREGVHVITRL